LRPARDAASFPLLIRTAVAFRPAEYNHRVGGGSQLVVALDGIPQEIGGDEDVGIVPILGIV
jgi:hypothetical protein